MSKHSIPRIEYLKVKNYKALHNVEFKNITPLTVFLGANGSGKSTIFDVFAFLSECFSIGLKRAWDKRGRFKELRTRGVDGPIVIELKYREKTDYPLITYHLAIEENKNPYVLEEWFEWRRGKKGKPFRFLDFQEGKGQVITGEMLDEDDERISEQSTSSKLLAFRTLGQCSQHPRVKALRRFLGGWYLYSLTADNIRIIPEAGRQERLSPTGDNLPNVIEYLQEEHPESLAQIFTNLSECVPHLEKVQASIMQYGRLLGQFKHASFEETMLAKLASNGTKKMLAYLTILYDPNPAQLVGIEEPENHLHPSLLNQLAEECRRASANTQLMLTTRSPFFIDTLKPEEVWVLYRDEKGFTHVKKTADIVGIQNLIDNGSLLGQLWMEGFFEAGNPLHNSSSPSQVKNMNMG